MTQQDAQAIILSASYTMANLITANGAQLSVGNGLVKWAQIRQFNRNIAAYTYLYNLGDYTSTESLALAACLQSMIGVNTSTATIDPNFQTPGIIIIDEGGGGSLLPPIVVDIVGGVTNNPITVPHPGMVWPSVLMYDPMGNEYTGATWVDTGTDIILLGADDGFGHFQDTFTLIIKV